ncbi:hypothetical protein AB0E96_14360 [Kitasatospora sp. NPDC036755]|uniref:hypothetical protein n=1 Tax=Kitasatospora sp. NPDC036755 TaxID=3154600 RepID=UPI0033CFB811
MPKFTEADTDPRRRSLQRATITPDEVAAMLAEAGPDRDLVVKLSFHAGLRPGEMDELTEADVTIRDGRHYLTVRGRVPRTIALPRIVGDAVEAVRPGLQPGDLLVLPHLDAEGAVARAMHDVLVTAGVTDATVHTPRGHLLDLLRTQHDLPLAHRLAYVGFQGSDPGALPDGWSEPIADRIDELAANAAAG